MPGWLCTTVAMCGSHHATETALVNSGASHRYRYSKRRRRLSFMSQHTRQTLLWFHRWPPLRSRTKSFREPKRGGLCAEVMSVSINAASSLGLGRCRHAERLICSSRHTLRAPAPKASIARATLLLICTMASGSRPPPCRFPSHSWAENGGRKQVDGHRGCGGSGGARSDPSLRPMSQLIFRPPSRRSESTPGLESDRDIGSPCS